MAPDLPGFLVLQEVLVLQDRLDLQELLAQWAFQEVEDHLESKVIRVSKVWQGSQENPGILETRATLDHQDHQG